MLRVVAGAVAALLLVSGATAQEGIKRTPLQKVDFPDGYTTVTGLAEIQPGVSAGRHTHPGIETGYVLEGETVMSIDGQPDQTMKAGDSYTIPAGVPHDAKAVGERPVKVIAVYVVERGKPLATPAP
ncbi:MAG: cupin domain-containing protein [Rhizobiaceae bacterium]|nr:cupin domain-containing protein [Rhizobiaceae bacterium]